VSPDTIGPWLEAVPSVIELARPAWSSRKPKSRSRSFRIIRCRNRWIAKATRCAPAAWRTVPCARRRRTHSSLREDLVSPKSAQLADERRANRLRY
jgi:hypothetical protein